VIPGWDEGLVGVKVGGRRQLIIPPALGYGSTAHGSIPANSILVFTVDVIGAQ
jgi:FKBP-type peptidyl-prolyl cis-trans isomerase